MLPPDLSGFAFRPDQDAAARLAARGEQMRSAGRLLVLGASHPTLLDRLVESGTPLLVVDSSRAALRRVRPALPPEVELLAEDPRELDAPGDVSAAVVTATAWRAIVHAEDRQRVLRSLAECVGASGTIILELERVPMTTAGSCGTLLWRRDGEHIAVSRADGPADLLLTAAPVEALAAEAAECCGGVACLLAFDDPEPPRADEQRPLDTAALRVHVLVAPTG